MSRFQVPPDVLVALKEKLDRTPRGLRPVEIPGTTFEFLVNAAESLVNEQRRLDEITEASKNFLEAYRTHLLHHEGFTAPLCLASDGMFNSSENVSPIQDVCFHFATHRLVCEGDDMLLCDVHASHATQKDLGDVHELSYAPALRELHEFLKLDADRGPGPLEMERRATQHVEQENVELKAKLEQMLHMDRWPFYPYADQLDALVHVFPEAYRDQAKYLAKLAILSGRAHERAHTSPARFLAPHPKPHYRAISMGAQAVPPPMAPGHVSELEEFMQYVTLKPREQK